MSGTRQYTQPQSSQNLILDGASLNVNIPAEKIERLHQRFSLSDDVRQWQSIPRNIYIPEVANPIFRSSAISNYNFIVIPFCNQTEKQNYYFQAHDRKLNANADNPLTMEIYAKLDRPLGNTKAYLHGLTFVAYDYNEPLPFIDMDILSKPAFIFNCIDNINTTIELGDALHQLRNIGISFDEACMVNLEGRKYKWSSLSSADDDGVNVIAPENIVGNGRWLLVDSSSGWDYKQFLIIEDAFPKVQTNSEHLKGETGKITSTFRKGIIVGMVDKSINSIEKLELFGNNNGSGLLSYNTSGRYTTANFPDFGNYRLTNAVQKSARKLLGQTAPRSAVVHGALPSDWLNNNFKLEIFCYIPNNEVPSEGQSRLIWSSEGTYCGHWATDEIIHQAISSIDVKIHDSATDLIAVVSGCGWFCYTDTIGNGEYADRQLGYTETDNGLNHTVRTLVQMPVKVQLDVRYSDI